MSPFPQDNRLVGIALPTGGSNAFEYDANGLRTKKTDSYGTTRYLLDGLSVIGQYGQDGTRQAWYTQSLARIDEVLNVVNNQGKFWYQADALGSTYALAGDSGAVVARGGYDVFGAPVPVSGNVGQPFGFTGREHDLDAGLVYSRERFLDPATGRFGRTDPLKFIAGPNFYAYAASGTTAIGDPMGLLMGPMPKTTVEAYAIQWWVPFLFLMMDLGVISGTAVMTYRTLFAEPRDKCPSDRETKDDTGPITYYRGLSVADERELGMSGTISSKMRRSGADIDEGFRAHMDGKAARAHRYTSRNSPYVGVTLYQSVARSFARGLPRAPKNPDDAPCGWVVSFTTRRPPAAPGVDEDGEFLFFWMLGLPGETIIPIEKVTPAWP